MARQHCSTSSIALLIASIWLSSIGVTESRADLTGKPLAPAPDVKSGVESALGSLLAGTIKGDILEATVTRDDPTRVVVRVSFTGFEDGSLWLETAGSDKKPQGPIKGSPPGRLEGGAGEVEHSLELDPNAPENTTVHTSYLRVCVAKAGKSTPSFVKLFTMKKIWKNGVRPENVVLSVTPRPIGQTATLGPTPTYSLPPKTIRPALNRVLLTKALTKPSATSPTSKSTAPSARAIAGVRALPGAGTGAKPPAPSGSTTKATSQVQTANRVLLTRTDSAAKLLSRNAGVAALSRNRFGVSQADKKQGAKGPAANPIEPLSQLRAEDIDLDPSHVLGVFPGFYPDQNASTGIYYFLPYSYSLRWDADNGYDLRMIYTVATSEGASGEVAIAARLDAGIGLRERQVATELIAAYAKVNGLPFKSLRALPIDSLSISISDDLRRYDIPPEKIAVTGMSDFLGQIDVSWLTDPVTKENLQQALVEDVGISGRVTLHPTGGALGSIDIPIQIRLADFGTFGGFRWSRSEAWRNKTPYPIKLKYLNALVLDPSSRPVVYSWDLEGASVLPRASVRWLAGSVPGWIDSRSKRMWLEYAVEDDCRTCDDEVIRSITGGVSSTGPSHITFHTITPLADVGAYEIAVQVRSRYFDPQAGDAQTRIVVLKADGQDFTVGPIFLGTREPGESIPGDALFEYLIDVIMADGTTHKGAHWIESNDTRLAIGRRQLEESLGSLPGSN